MYIPYPYVYITLKYIVTGDFRCQELEGVQIIELFGVLGCFAARTNRYI